MRRFKLFLLAIFTVFGALFGLLLFNKQSLALPTGFSRTQIINSGLSDTSGFEFAPDGRIFILERTGAVKIYKNGTLLPTPFYTFSSVASGDRGLIGITFDPNFAINNFVYFYYTDTDLRNYLVRMDASTDVFTGTPEVIFQTNEDSNLLHVGGSVAFGPDGMIYLAIGDNGYPPNAQDLTNPFGKIHRINPDGTAPIDNPFYDIPDASQTIWAYGFRNPWRFQFDELTGALYGGDVGNDTWEEVNLIEAGKNYGWPQSEGACTANCTGVTDPIYAYNHDGLSSAITGGPVYQGNDFPAEYQGDYFFGDYARGFIRNLNFDANGNVTSMETFDDTAGSVVDLKVHDDGSLYYITYWPAALYRISYQPENQIPVAVATSDIDSGVEPLTINFSSAGSYDPEGESLTYNWDFGDGSTSTDENPIKTYPNVGVYTVNLTVSDGVNQNQAVPIVINVGLPPTILFGAPDDGSMYRAGDEITFNVFANDAAGFDINDGDIVTDVIFHHDDHTHPFIDDVIGRTGTFIIPDNGEAAHDTWYEIQTTATDTNGLSTTESIFIYPYKSTVTLATDIIGANVFLDGTPHAAPYTFIGVENFVREISADDYVIIDDELFVFDAWSDGGEQTHNILTPIDDSTYTAQYVSVGPANGGTFETFDDFGNPDYVSSTAWGDHTPIFTITTDSHTGNYAGRIDVSDYVSGDAKWFLEPVDVVAGEEYSYSAQIKNSQITKAVADITLDDGSHQYIWLGLQLPSTTEWQEITAELTMPENAVTATVYHYLEGDGYLQVDNLILLGEVVAPPPPPPPPPPPTGDEHFINGDIETIFEGSPASWSMGSWGDNTVTFDTVTGPDSATALRVELADFITGNAKWVTHEMPIDHTGEYTFSNVYRSSVESALVFEITMDDGSKQYIWLGGIVASPVWTSFTQVIDIPLGAVGIRVEQQISDDGWLETDDYSLVHDHQD